MSKNREKIRSATGDPEHVFLKVSVLSMFLLAAVLFSFLIGRYSISPSELLSLIASRAGLVKDCLDPTAEMIFFSVRLPRVLCALLVGAGLSVAGCSYQGVFRNPMVSPDILGATAGSGFGAAIAMLLDFSTAGIQIFSFATGLLAVFLSYMICVFTGKRSNPTLTLILAGMVISALFQAGISLIKYVADPYTKLPEITFWLLGSLASVNMNDVMQLFIPIAAACIPLFMYRWELNLLSFSDEEAQSMGVSITRLRITVIICSTVIASAVVSVCGIIGWVGLIIPHLARMIVGPNYKILIPSGILLGGTYLLLVDDIARGWMAMEIPLGILTAIAGTPFFIFLLCRGRGESL